MRAETLMMMYEMRSRNMYVYTSSSTHLQQNISTHSQYSGGTNDFNNLIHSRAIGRLSIALWVRGVIDVLWTKQRQQRSGDFGGGACSLTYHNEKWLYTRGVGCDKRIMNVILSKWDSLNGTDYMAKQYGIRVGSSGLFIWLL